MRNLYIYDSRKKWIAPCIQAAKKRKWNAVEVKNFDHMMGLKGGGHALVFPHAHPDMLMEDQDIALATPDDIKLITDFTQVDLYEDKRGQIRRWGKWMPDTWIFEDEQEALSFVESADYPFISKADVGASSYNVRLIESKDAAVKHVRQLFNGGIEVNHCDGLGTKSLQRWYAIFQEFIPHQITYRVNVIGRQAAVFFRHCYPDRPMAQTGNVTPAYEMTPELESLFTWCDSALQDIKSNWVALDVLKSERGWKLLETSLRWPWPSPGDCNNATFFNSGKKWSQMWDILIDEIEDGVWG